jgi:hypothetical protein
MFLPNLILKIDSQMEVSNLKEDHSCKENNNKPEKLQVFKDKDNKDKDLQLRKEDTDQDKDQIKNNLKM